jgi:hypothetical protein
MATAPKKKKGVYDGDTEVYVCTYPEHPWVSATGDERHPPPGMQFEMKGKKP